MDSWEEKVTQNLDTYTSGQKGVARYLLDNCHEAAFLTAAEIGRAVGVSESTVVRFAAAAGFNGFPDLQKQLQQAVARKLTTVERLLGSEPEVSEQNPALFEKVIRADIQNLRSTLESLSPEVFEDAIDATYTARAIYVVGLRSLQGLALFLEFALRMIFREKKVVAVSATDYLEQMINLGPEDLVIGLSFTRYTRRTVDILSFARDREARILALTDSQVSPLARLADHTLVARSQLMSFVDSFVAPLSVINALVTGVGLKEKAKTLDLLSELESIWKKYKVYYDED